MPKPTTSMSPAAKKVVNDEMLKLANNMGYNNPDQMFKAWRTEMINVEGNVLATANLINNSLQSLFSVVPTIFIQWLELRDQTTDMTRLMNEDYYAKVDEGNGVKFFSTIAGAPTNTLPITNMGNQFTPDSLTPGYGMNWEIRYFAEKNQLMLSADGFAFHTVVVVQPQSVLSQFRTDAGQGYLASMIDNLWIALTNSKYDFWVTKKIREPLALYTQTTATGSQELTTTNTPYLNKNYFVTKEANAFLVWLNIARFILKMTKNNNIFNADQNFIRPSTVPLRDIRVYVSVNTYVTYKNNLMSQLFNNSDFAEAFREAKIEVLPYPPRWMNISTDAVTINYVTYDETTNVTTAQTQTVKAGQMIKPILMARNIPSSLIWMTDTTEELDDNTVIITHAGSLRMINQTSIPGDTQHWSYNNTNSIMCYEIWAAKIVPDSKYIVYRDPALNVNPTTATITIAGDNVSATQPASETETTGETNE